MKEKKKFNQAEYIDSYNKSNYKRFDVRLKPEELKKVEEIQKKENLSKREFILKAIQLMQ